MSDQSKFQHNPDRSASYHIRIEGHLGPQWESWFGDVELTQEDSGHTLLVCRGMDQAALHGMLKKIRDLGIPLLSVTRVSDDQTEPPTSDG